MADLKACLDALEAVSATIERGQTEASDLNCCWEFHCVTHERHSARLTPLSCGLCRCALPSLPKAESWRAESVPIQAALFAWFIGISGGCAMLCLSVVQPRLD